MRRQLFGSAFETRSSTLRPGIGNSVRRPELLPRRKSRDALVGFCGLSNRKGCLVQGVSSLHPGIAQRDVFAWAATC